MKTLHFSIITALTLIFTGCDLTAQTPVKATGADKTQTISTGFFDEIKVSNAIQLVYTQDQNTSVSVTAPESILPLVQVRVVDKDLLCDIKGNVDLSGRAVKVNVSAPSVKDFKASSNASIIVPGAIVTQGDIDANASSTATITFANITAKEFDAEASSTGSITANVTAQEINAEASSSSKITITGRCTKVEAEASSTSTINIDQLVAEYGKLQASSAATINANPSTNYSTNTSSSGTINR